MSEGDARTNRLRHASGWSFVNGRPERLGVAVSGGSDSMALLDLMQWHGSVAGFDVRAVTVNHGLRPEAADEAAMVAAFCKKRGIPHDTLLWRGWDGSGNLQAKARKARYGLIADWARTSDVDWIALGHTEDDQAETVLMRLARRSGVDGLAGMPDRFKRCGLTFVRPLLMLDRNALQDYLRDQGIIWRDDPSNEDDSFERVRARKAMETLAELGIDADTLAAVAHNARLAKWALDHYAWLEVAENGIADVDRGDVILPMSPTPEHMTTSEILRRLKNAAIMWISGAEYPPRAAALVNMEAAFFGADRHTLSGCLVTLVRGKESYEGNLRFTREYNAVKDAATPTDMLWDGRWKLDGPHAPDLRVRALGEAVKDCPDRRETGLPRSSLMSSPAIWRGDHLIAAPLAGLSNGWTAEATGRGKFAKFLLSR